MVNSKIQSLCPPPPLWLVMSIPLPIRVNLSPIHVQHPYLLDIVLSNTSFIHDVHVEPLQSFGSDHFLVLFNIECSLMKPFQKHRMRHVFDFKNVDMDGLSHVFA